MWDVKRRLVKRKSLTKTMKAGILFHVVKLDCLTAQMSAQEAKSLEKRVELSLLMDFYGPLLTEHRRDVMRLYCDEDMGLQEIADRLSISRQGVHDAVKSASSALARYEEMLGLADRYLRIGREIKLCRELLTSVHAEPGSEAALSGALEALERINGIER